jgi:type II secretory pathway predicted ATPase ExeA
MRDRRPVNLWRVLLKAGLGCRTLSLSAGLGRNTVSMICHGHHGGTRATWERITKALAGMGIRATVEELRSPLLPGEVAWCDRAAAGRMGDLAGARRPGLVRVAPGELWPVRAKGGGQQNGGGQDMLSSAVWERLGLRANPWREPSGRNDLYLTTAMRECAGAVEQCCQEHGFLAICGEIGSGKTTVLRYALDPLYDNAQYAISHVCCLARERANARSIQEAMLRDLAGDVSIPSSHESLTRKVKGTVHHLLGQGIHPALIIDEAQALHPSALPFLKRIREECSRGFMAGCAVILIGQTNAQPDLRRKLQLASVQEVSRRVTIYDLPGLGPALGDYVQWRMARAGAGNRKPVEDAALAALAAHYKTTDPRSGREAWLPVGPQEIEQVLTTAMTLAVKYGESRVTARYVHMALGEVCREPAAAEGGGA